jgi:hypothetical protein
MFDIDISQPLDPAPVPYLVVVYKPKPFILCLYKSLSDESLSLLRQYGKVILFSQIYINISIHKLLFDYLIIDFRDEEARYYYQRFIKRYMDHYNIILYRYSFENNNGIEFHNELSTFPNRQVSKEEFDTILLETPIPAPNCCFSFCKYLCK